MREFLTRAIGAGVLTTLSLSGCGGEESISKEDFVAAANTICADGTAELEEAWQTSRGPDFFIDYVMPNIRAQVAEMRALGFPVGDDETVGAMLDDTIAILDEVEANPETVGSEADPFADVNQQMTDYGLNVCADG